MRGFFLIAFLAVVCGAAPNAESLWKPKPPRPPPNEGTLRLVHVLFRHGDRNPENDSTLAGNPYSDESWYPEGFGQLTNKGKMREYRLGQFFRERYDSFLGDIWNIDFIDFRSTDYNRTKMSGELVMAGLWPPRGSNIWNKDLAWQPIPYNYAQISDDNLLLGYSSKAYTEAFNKVMKDPWILADLGNRYSETMQILSDNTGISNTNFYDAGLGYYDVIKIQNELGFKMPKWISQVYPEPLKSLAVDLYKIMTITNADLSKILAGNLVNKIINDSAAKKNGTIAPSKVKMFVYSAHDTNVGPMYLALQATPMFEPPPYGSCLMFELHEIQGVWGIKLFLHDYNPGSPHPLAIPGCRHFCPIDQFRSLVAEILP